MFIQDKSFSFTYLHIYNIKTAIITRPVSKRRPNVIKMKTLKKLRKNRLKTDEKG